MLSKLCCLSTDSCKGECIGLARNQNIKLTYIIILLLLLITSQLINYSPQSDQTRQQEIQKYHCTDIVYKQSSFLTLCRYQSSCIAQKKTSLDMLALTIFHLVIFVLLLPKTKHVKVINEGLWIIKLLFLTALVFLIAFTFGPSISSYVQLAATIMSPILYLLTVIIDFMQKNIILIDNIYFLEFKINNLSEKHKKVHIVKVIFSLLFWGLSIVLNVFSYFENELWVSISCSVLIVIFLILTFLRISRNNSFFVYALVMIYLNLVAYSIHTEVDEQKNDNFRVLEHGYRIFILIFALFGMLAEGGNQIRTKKSTVNQILALNTSKKQEDNRYVSSNKWIMYHVIMVVIAFGFTAVFNYRYDSTEETSRQILGIGRISWWVSVVLVYFWSIIVQKIYPEQDFSELENYFKEFQLN